MLRAAGTAILIYCINAIIHKHGNGHRTDAASTVTICHSRTKEIKEITRQADILIVAIGKPKLVDDTYIKEGAVVIDGMGLRIKEKEKINLLLLPL